MDDSELLERIQLFVLDISRPSTYLAWTGSSKLKGHLTDSPGSVLSDETCRPCFLSISSVSLRLLLHILRGVLTLKVPNQPRKTTDQALGVLSNHNQIDSRLFASFGGNL